MSFSRELEHEANPCPSPATASLAIRLVMAGVCLPRPPAQARPEELPSGSICYGTSDKKEAMEGENLDLHPGHVALGKLLNASESLFQHP